MVDNTVVRINPNDQDYYLVFNGKKSNPIAASLGQNQMNQMGEASAPKESIYMPPQSHEYMDSLNYDNQNTLDSTSDKVTERLLKLIHQAQSAFYDKEYEKCYELLEQSLKIKKTAEAYAMMGSLNYVQNRSGIAIQYWKESLKINPDQPDIKKAIESIEGEAKL